MNRAILCEGKTDAILLGYYLRKIAGWEHTTSTPSDLKIRAHKKCESSKCKRWILDQLRKWGFIM